MLKGKHIVLGVTGGIAVYKAAEFVRLLVKAEANVHVVMTRHAEEFMMPLTFQTLSGNPVVTDAFALFEESQIGHVALGLAELIIILPRPPTSSEKLPMASPMTLSTMVSGFESDPSASLHEHEHGRTQPLKEHAALIEREFISSNPELRSWPVTGMERRACRTGRRDGEGGGSLLSQRPEG
jgi:hypothetical protein